MATSNKNFKVKNGLEVGTTTVVASVDSSGNANLSGNVTATGKVSASELTSTNSSGSEGGQVNLAKPATTSLSGNVIVDIYENKIRFFDSAGTNRGAYIDLTAAGAGVGTNLLGGVTGAMNASYTYASKQSNVSGSNVTLASVSLTTNGYPIQVIATGDMENNSAGGWVTLQLYRGSTAIGNIVHAEGSAGSENAPFALTAIDVPAAGTYTYSLKINNSAGGTFNFGETDGPTITVIELSGPKGDAGAAGTSSDSFKTISANGTSVVADSSTDTLTITPGDGLSITGNATSDTITFTPNVAGASANGIVTTGSQTFAGEKTFSNTITASANIVANTGFVSADTFRIDTTFTGGTTQPGEIAWDVDEGTVMFQLADGAVTHRIGQQLDIRVVNNTGSTISEGAVVYINGSSGQEPTIALANAATEGASSKTIGVVTHQGGIANAASGYICISGIMRGVDVGAYAAGTPLWLSNVAGVFTDTKPTPPENGVFIGWVVKAGNAGSILVAIQNGYEVDELHDVKYTSLATNDILQRTANNLWENKTLAGANIANLAASTVTFAGNVIATINMNAATVNATNVIATTSNATTFNGNLSATTITVSGQSNVNAITVAQQKNAAVVSGYNSASGAFAHASKVIMTANATGSAAPTTRPDGTSLVAGDIWIDW